MDSYYIKSFIGIAFVILLYFVLLNVILMITDKHALKILKNSVGKEIKSEFGRKMFHKILLFTALSYLISIIVVTIIFACYSGYSVILSFLLALLQLVAEPFAYPIQILPVLIIAVLSAFLVSIIFNYFVVFRKLDMTKLKRLHSALIVSAMTAPYFYFVPFGWLIWVLG